MASDTQRYHEAQTKSAWGYLHNDWTPGSSHNQVQATRYKRLGTSDGSSPLSTATRTMDMADTAARRDRSLCGKRLPIVRIPAICRIFLVLERTRHRRQPVQLRGMHRFPATRTARERLALRSLLAIIETQVIFFAGPMARYPYWIATLAVQFHDGVPLDYWNAHTRVFARLLLFSLCALPQHNTTSYPHRQLQIMYHIDLMGARDSP